MTAKVTPFHYGYSCFRGARGAAPCSERSDAKQPGHSNVRAVRLAERTIQGLPLYRSALFISSTNWNLLLRQTESFKRYRLPTNISASIVKVFSFLKSISVLSTWKSSGVMSAKILISSNGISYDSETLFW